MAGKTFAQAGHELNAYRHYWQSKRLKADDKYYKLYSSISNNPSPNYVPENLYYTYFEPTLNNKMMLKTYSNKNLYQHIYDQHSLFPKAYVRCINGTFYRSDGSVCTDLKKEIEEFGADKFIIKVAMDSGGGKGVELFEKKENTYVSNTKKPFNTNELRSQFGDDFVIQEYIIQHDFFKRFNESSVNTIRIFTYRSVKDEQIHILHSVLRIGQPGSIVDNQASGGLSCGINNKKLNPFAIDKKGNRFLKVGNYEFSDQMEIPLFEHLTVLAKKIAAQNPYARLLGLDFCIDASNTIKLLEVNNSNNEINFYQMNNGPLFGQFTDEIVNWCLTQPKTVCIDFSVKM